MSKRPYNRRYGGDVMVKLTHKELKKTKQPEELKCSRGCGKEFDTKKQKPRHERDSHLPLKTTKDDVPSTASSIGNAAIDANPARSSSNTIIPPSINNTSNDNSTSPTHNILATKEEAEEYGS